MVSEPHSSAVTAVVNPPAVDHPAVAHPTAGTDQSVTKPPPWQWLITLDLMLSELAAGIFTAAALCALIGGQRFAQVAEVGFLAAFPLSIVDMICLVLDLGHPLRFHHMLRVFNRRSPMSVGVWVISLFSFIAFCCFVMTLMSPEMDPWRSIVGAIGILPAMFVGGYKGVLFSTTAQPGWKDSRWLGAELASSAGCWERHACFWLRCSSGQMQRLKGCVCVS